jgi:hypothetical protein
MTLPTPWRKTTQHLMPAHIAQSGQELVAGQYDIYPAHDLGSGQIEAGFDGLAQRLAGAGQVMIDGFPGVLWVDFRERLGAALMALGVRTHWIDVAAAMKSTTEIDALVAPFLGGDDPIFGHRFSGELADFFEAAALNALQPDPSAMLNILYGCGAALADWQGTLVYVDVPKNEIQFRQRAGSVTCLGAEQPLAPKPAYKRSYFVDWVAANRHKLALHGASTGSWIASAQRRSPLPAATRCGRGWRSLPAVFSACARGSSRGRGAGSGFASRCPNSPRTCPTTPGRSS